MKFTVGDHVENKPVATVDGIVYRVEDNFIRFCDGFGINYKMRAEGLRTRYKPFAWQETLEIMKVNAHKFQRTISNKEAATQSGLSVRRLTRLPYYAIIQL